MAGSGARYNWGLWGPSRIGWECFCRFLSPFRNWLQKGNRGGKASRAPRSTGWEWPIPKRKPSQMSRPLDFFQVQNRGRSVLSCFWLYYSPSIWLLKVNALLGAQAACCGALSGKLCSTLIKPGTTKKNKLKIRIYTNIVQRCYTDRCKVVSLAILIVLLWLLMSLSISSDANIF